MNLEPDPSATTEPRPLDLNARYALLHQEMVQRLERTAVVESHGLLYILLGWEHLIACAISNYLVEVVQLQRPYRWPYLVLWLTWAALALGTVRFVRRPPQAEPSPLLSLSDRIWAMFFLLCGNVVMLNVTAGLPVFVFLPALATLASFAFTFMTILVSRRFLAAIGVMFATGMAIAHFPRYGFLLYGAGWLIVLEALGMILWRKRKTCLGRSAEADSTRPVVPS
jgi:hypothetical protein